MNISAKKTTGISCAALSIIMLMACVGQARDRTRGYAVVEWQGRLAKMPLEMLDGEAADALGQYALAEYGKKGVKGLPGSESGGWAGMSGSPVYSNKGEMIGACSTQFMPGYANALQGIRGVDELNEVLGLGRIFGSPVPGGGEGGAALLAKPGEQVTAMWIWGDHTEGVSGVISTVEGNEVVAMAHSIAKQQGQGPRVYAMAKTPMITLVAEQRGYHRTLCSEGPIIGTFTYDSLCGLYGVLGATPDCIGVSVTIASPLLKTVRYQYYIARDTYTLYPSIKKVLQHALHWSDALSIVMPDGVAQMSIDIDDKRFGVNAFEGGLGLRTAMIDWCEGIVRPAAMDAKAISVGVTCE